MKRKSGKVLLTFLAVILLALLVPLSASAVPGSNPVELPDNGEITLEYAFEDNTHMLILNFNELNPYDCGDFVLEYDYSVTIKSVKCSWDFDLFAYKDDPDFATLRLGYVAGSRIYEKPNIIFRFEYDSSEPPVFTLTGKALFVDGEYEKNVSFNKEIIAEYNPDCVVSFVDEVPAKCEVNGIKAHYACSHCDTLYTDKTKLTQTSLSELTIPALQHEYVKATIAPSCTEKGYTEYTCVCGNSYTTNYVDKLPHKYTSTCDEDCNVCGTVRKVNHSDKTTVTKATLTKNGNIKTACTLCGKVASETSISYPKTFTLSETAYTFDGYTKKPAVTVTDAAGKVLTKGTDYTVTYAEDRKSVGTYKVTVKMIGNYTGTKTLSFKIKPIDISTCDVKLSATSYTFNGYVKTPAVTVTNSYGTKLTKNKHYTVTYDEDRKSVGTYKVTVKMIGNYTGTKTLTFKINPINISTCNVKLSATSLVYNGNVRTPVVTVTNSYGTKLTKGTHYTVKFSEGRKNVGTYKVTVTMKGNYTGTKTLTFKINPPKTTVASLTAGAKKITVNLTKKTTQVTGYQIQYSTNKNFTNAKTVTLAKNTTVKTTLSGLNSAKTYYVRVRTFKTVNDVKYYSGWSAYKYTKTR